MAPSNETLHPQSLQHRAVLLSIVIFWLFYFSLVTIRSAVLGFGDQYEMLARRSGVTLVSMATTWLLYLLLRKLGGRSLRRSIIAASLFAIPAAVIYSTANWFAFSDMDKKHAKAIHNKVVVMNAPSSASSPPPVPELKIGENGIPIPPVPSAPPPTSVTTIQVGTMDGEEELTPVKAIADNSANGYFFFIAWAALYLALSYARAAQVQERRAAEFRSAAQGAELRALRYQVNPHFLFNTLNSLSALVMSDKRDEAERMILNLSTFFRTSLSGDPTEDVKLSEEIQLQRLYLDIEAVRFPKRLQIEIEVPEALRDVCVPGLILQPLVENAVKYGVARSRQPVTVRILAHEDSGGLVLSVENDGKPGDLAAEGGGGTGVGLANVRDRLLARFGDQATCRWGSMPGGGFAVLLTMPIVRHDC
jgi:hypothetical protein